MFKKGSKYRVIAIFTVVIIPAIALLLYYYQQPNIQVVESSINNIAKNPSDTRALDHERVSENHIFAYTFENDGIHRIMFDNGFSTFSLKSVTFSYITSAIPTHHPRSGIIPISIQP